MTKSTLPDKSRNPESIKNNRHSLKALLFMYLQLAMMRWGLSASRFIYNFVSQVIRKKISVAKMCLAFWKALLYENDCHYWNCINMHFCENFLQKYNGNKFSLVFSKFWLLLQIHCLQNQHFAWIYIFL